MTMIELKWIEKYYQDQFAKTYSLRNTNLKIDEGEFVSIMRPSGSCRSSLLYLFGTLDAASAGEYFFYEEPVSKISARELSDLYKSNVGIVFQDYHLIDELTIFENVELPLLHPGISSRDRKEKVDSILKKLKILNNANQFPNKLTNDQRQRVTVARAIVGNPKIILADEPMENQDSAMSDEIINIFSELNEKGTTILMITNSLKYSEYSNRVLHLFGDQIETEKNNNKFYAKENIN